MTPFEALFSRTPRVTERFFCYQAPTHLNMIESMENKFKTARACVHEIQQKNRRRARYQHTSQTYFEPGDIVTLNFGKAERIKKLQVYRKGLFEVQSRVSPNTYRVLSLEKRKFHPIVHFTKNGSTQIICTVKEN